MTATKGLVFGAFGAALLGVTACGMASESSFASGKAEEAPRASSGSSSGSGGGADAGLSSVPGPGLNAKGVVLVHAAQFPSLRVCFEGKLDSKPLPDKTAMPDANVIGMDVGAALRFDPIQANKALGKVYVIEERVIRTRVGAEDTRTCKQLICEQGTTCLRKGSDYVEAGNLTTTTLGASSVEILAITGCGNELTLNALGANSAECGAGWDRVFGNVDAKVLTGLAPVRGGKGQIPVQLVNLAPQLTTLQGNLEVTFGELTQIGTQKTPVASQPPLESPRPAATLSVDTSNETVFATHGFRIERTTGSGMAFRREPTLADVQDLSAPRDLPDTYYATGRSFALLLLGDPRESLKPAAQRDARRDVHLVAVPISEPEPTSPEAGGSSSSSSGGTADGG